jgi:hypothetical protein
VVVRQHRPSEPSRRADVAAGRAQVCGRSERGVVHVERVAHAVPVAVGRERAPGSGDELHRADRPVEHRVTVEATVVGVGHGRAARAVEPDADDARCGRPVAKQGRAAEAAVVGLDATDGGEQLPRQPAPRIGARQQPSGVLVRRERHRGYAVRGENRRRDRPCCRLGRRRRVRGMRQDDFCRSGRDGGSRCVLRPGMRHIHRRPRDGRATLSPRHRFGPGAEQSDQPHCEEGEGAQPDGPGNPPVQCCMRRAMCPGAGAGHGRSVSRTDRI